EGPQPEFAGYEIHLGETSLGNGVRPLLTLQRLNDEVWSDDGAVSRDGRVLGTYLHGLFDSEPGLAFLLNHWRSICGKTTTTRRHDPIAERERRYDALADHFRRNLKLDLIYDALDGHA